MTQGLLADLRWPAVGGLLAARFLVTFLMPFFCWVGAADAAASAADVAFWAALASLAAAAEAEMTPGAQCKSPAAGGCYKLHAPRTQQQGILFRI